MKRREVPRTEKSREVKRIVCHPVIVSLRQILASRACEGFRNRMKSARRAPLRPPEPNTMPDKFSDRMPDRMPNNYCQIERQKKCQIECIALRCQNKELPRERDVERKLLPAKETAEKGGFKRGILRETKEIARKGDVKRRGVKGWASSTRKKCRKKDMPTERDVKCQSCQQKVMPRERYHKKKICH